jgi:hypothetical protein
MPMGQPQLKNTLSLHVAHEAQLGIVGYLSAKRDGVLGRFRNCHRRSVARAPLLIRDMR